MESRTLRAGFGAIFVTCAALSSPSACTSFSSSENERSDGGSDAAGGPANLLTNGDFESGCASWTGANATLTEEAIGKSDQSSCRVCAQANVAFSIYASPIRVPVLPGAKYVAKVHLRAAPGRAAPTILTLGVDLSPMQVGPLTSGPELDETWKPVSALIILEAGSESGELSLRVQSLSIDTCFLIDDAVLYREP
jgi:hypothetical protein